MVNSVRDNQRVWPTCPECGCRLDYSSNGLDAFLYHFGGLEGMDARGCKCVLADNVWFEPHSTVEHIER